MGKICQSCSMPMENKELFGTNKDQSINEDYCIYCYKNGEFLDKVNMEKYRNECPICRASKYDERRNA